MNENKPYSREEDYKNLMMSWDCLIEWAGWISADTEKYEMDQCIVDLFHRTMAGTFRFLRLNRPENDDSYTRFHLGLYGIITAYTGYFSGFPTVKTVEAYFFHASIRVTNNLRRCFFDRTLLDNSIVHADHHSKPTPEDIDISFDYDFENGDLLPIAKVLRTWDTRARKVDV